jgi:hypothetical protein
MDSRAAGVSRAAGGDPAGLFSVIGQEGRVDAGTPARVSPGPGGDRQAGATAFAGAFIFVKNRRIRARHAARMSGSVSS